MCGIIGAASSRNVGKLLVQGLHKMEYRGYDSAGIALHQKDSIFNLRTLGKVSLLEEKMIDQKPKKEIRLAWLDNFSDCYAYEQGVRSVCQRFLKSLHHKDIKIDEVSPKFSAAKVWDSWTTLRSQSINFDLEKYYLKNETRTNLKPEIIWEIEKGRALSDCLLYTSPSPRDKRQSRMPSSA